MEKLIDRLRRIAPVSGELIQYLYNIVTDKFFKRGQFITRAGEICQKIFFIEKGLVVIYLVQRTP